jgi:mono/diheme cytochrome c family protein
MKIFLQLGFISILLSGTVNVVLAANDVPSRFTNMGGVLNTRHNMSQSTESLQGGATMNNFRNNYGQVCVYCHTPHGANTSAAAPLWNRNLPTTTVYSTYDKLNTTSLTMAVSQPGASSLPCLSCHDGSQAIDAIINMPGSGQYNATASAANAATWIPTVAGQSKSNAHLNLVGCISCHNGDAAGIYAGLATDFSVFLIGTDLKNDHPVGILFPTVSGNGTDWNTPGGAVTRGAQVTKFFDVNPADGRMDKGEIRLYDDGKGASVECASCHDPHGVPSAGPGSVINPTFLRKSNADSAVCMTCHNK